MAVTLDHLITAATSEESFLQTFRNAFYQQGQQWMEAHYTILRACYRNPGLSPAQTKLKGNTPETLALSWLKKYRQGFENRISRRISKPSGTVADPIIDTIINSR